MHVPSRHAKLCALFGKLRYKILSQISQNPQIFHKCSSRL